MDSTVKCMAYLILAFTIFNFFYDASSWVNGFTLYHGYFIFLVGIIIVLLRFKIKQDEQEKILMQKQKELLHQKWHLNQIKCLNDLSELDHPSFQALIINLFESYGMEHIDEMPNVLTQTSDLMFLNNGNKHVVRIQDQNTSNDLMTELFICNGIKHTKSYEVDEISYISTTICEDEIRLFAMQNEIELLDGGVLMDKLKDQQIKPKLSEELKSCL